MHHIAPFIIVPTVFFLLFVILIASMSIYFAPTFFAFYFQHNRRWWIAGLNLLFGWSGAAWFVCIIWAWSERVATKRAVSGYFS